MKSIIIPKNLSKEGKIWFNRAMVFFHKSDKVGRFAREFNFIRLELHIVPIQKEKGKKKENI